MIKEIERIVERWKSRQDKNLFRTAIGINGNDFDEVIINKVLDQLKEISELYIYSHGYDIEDYETTYGIYDYGLETAFGIKCDLKKDESARLTQTKLMWQLVRLNERLYERCQDLECDTIKGLLWRIWDKIKRKVRS